MQRWQDGYFVPFFFIFMGFFFNFYSHTPWTKIFWIFLTWLLFWFIIMKNHLSTLASFFHLLRALTTFTSWALLAVELDSIKVSMAFCNSEDDPKEKLWDWRSVSLRNRWPSSHKAWGMMGSVSQIREFGTWPGKLSAWSYLSSMVSMLCNV